MFAHRDSRRRTIAAILLLPTIAFSSTPHAADAAEAVNIYSYREPQLMEPLLKSFTEKTGIKTNVVFAKDGLVERLISEGRNSPADVLLTNESGLLMQAKAQGATQPVASSALEKAIPANLRDPDNHWFALTQRARVLYVAKDRVSATAMTLEELAEPKWKGKICIRSGQHTYNVALVASMIAHLGDEKAETWLKGLKANLARKPAGGDREAVRDVQAGLCDIAIANTYYMAAMLKNPDQTAWANAVRIVFPNAGDRGTHVNISGIAIAAHAPHKANAQKLVEFLASTDAQAVYAEANSEYPVVAGVAESQLLKSWGPLKADAIPLSKLAELRRKASELIDKVKFDSGPSS
ncbi:MAG: iron ABC transporter substrate-binding protein [Hyphomicrobium sp.]|nr:MAG: iron ABC transporter substrate-binding protein [Hyphomicrobium sp.]